MAFLDPVLETRSLAPTLLLSMRIPFVVLTPVCVFLGLASAIRTHPGIDLLNLLLALIGAIAAHVSVNLFNEYVDFRSGLDARTKRTPFSGGSGAIIENPAALLAVMRAACIALGVTVAIGALLVYRCGPGVLPIGFLGVLIVVTYSGWINRHPFACLLAPGIGVGPLMVVGTYRVLTGEFDLEPALVSLVPLFLTSNLLLLNQFPDRDADMGVGRRHFPITYGFGPSVVVYGAFVTAAASVIVGGTVAGLLPGTSAFALIPLSAAGAACLGAVKHAADTERLLPYLTMNAIAAVLTPLVLAISLLI